VVNVVLKWLYDKQNRRIKTMNERQAERLWAKVQQTKNKDDCWEWTGAKNPGGYGCVKIDSKNHPVHRVVYEIFYGEIPTGYCVGHYCGSKTCCNPTHLFLSNQMLSRWMVEMKKFLGITEECCTPEMLQKSKELYKAILNGDL
jgi:hypothetical protein